MRRRVVKIDEIREYAKNMGFCKDDITRWYMFNMNGEPCIYFNYGKIM